jgi:transposase
MIDIIFLIKFVKEIIMSYKKWIGVDVSKEVIDIAIYDGKQYTLFQIKNQKKAIIKFFSKLEKAGEYHVVMEATGIYHLVLFTALIELEFAVSVVNPLIIKRYSEMKMKRAKTDIVDARLIAMYAFEQKPKLSQLPNATQEKIFSLFKAVEVFQKIMTSLNNRLLALKSYNCQHETVINEIKKNIRSAKSSIKKLENEIYDIIENNYAQLNKRLMQIPGVGPKTSSMIIGCFGYFENFDNAKQVVSFAGLNPNPRLSGKSVNRGSNISKKGNPLLRKMLYLAALSAKTCNPNCKMIYERLLNKGMPKMKALVAVAHKLLRQIFAIAKYNRIWRPDYCRKCLT